MTTILSLNLNDGNFIWQVAENYRVIITKLQLILPRLLFNVEKQKLYMSEYLDMRKWTYLHENIEVNNATTKRAGTWRISTGITRPGQVIVFKINSANIAAQTANPSLHNTFSVSTDPRTLNSCYLEVGNGNECPGQV